MKYLVPVLVVVLFIGAELLYRKYKAKTPVVAPAPAPVTPPAGPAPVRTPGGELKA